jgi:PAS domain S-box-containing protein
MGERIAIDVSALSRFEQAVMRFDLEERCDFANAAACELMGSADPVGLPLSAFFPDGQERERVAVEFGKRLRGDASSYQTCFTRPATGERIPISVFALPVIAPDGAIAGSLAILRDRREEEVTRAIHQAVETLRSGQAIIDALAAQLRRLIGFDAFKVIPVSEDRRHLRVLRPSADHDPARDTFKWWPMPAFIAGTIDAETPRTIDVREMFEQPDYALMAENDPATREFLESGVRYTLSLPICSGDEIRAFLSLDSRGDRPFTDGQLALCQRLPLGQAVLMALHFEEQRSLQACVDLVGEMGRQASNVDAVAAVLTQRLTQDFGWDEAVVFQRDEDHGRFRAISQSAGQGGLRDSECLVDGECGLVADAFGQQRLAYEEIEPAADAARPLRSRLALPIPGDTRRWVLQLASCCTQAYAQEEERALTMLALEAGHILERVALLEMRAAILNSINDAVVETDRRCLIRRANPAALRILGLADEAQAQGRSLKDFIADTAMAEAIAGTVSFSRHLVEIAAADGRRLGAALSGALLPLHLGGRVFVISDLTYEREAEKLATLKEVFRHASLESRLPLALAAGWLSDLGRGDGALRPVIEAALKQIRKADLPLERLLRLSTPDGPTSGRQEVDLGELVEQVWRELPESEQGALSRGALPAGVRVLAPREDLRFCLESALSFALRTRPQDRLIGLSISQGRRTAAISLSGDWAPGLGADASAGVLDRWRRRTATDVALAADEISAIVGAAGGRFRSELATRVMFELELPLAATGGSHGLDADPS